MAGSSLERASDVCIPTHAGPEIGVASTKAFTAQLLVLARLALEAGLARGTLTHDAYTAHLADLATVPDVLAQVLPLEASILGMAQALVPAKTVLYLGRGLYYPLALEGALKLKELSYIHAEGYAAGEMKHGPIALVDRSVPIVALAPSDELFEKMAANIQEVAARDGQLIILTDPAGREALAHLPATFLTLPPVSGMTGPFAYSLALQLLAYHTACLKGTDADQPRNLAKSVTVE